MGMGGSDSRSGGSRGKGYEKDALTASRASCSSTAAAVATSVCVVAAHLW
jgi:hypothetical protein